jgi:CRISPR-associated protein Cas5t
MDFLRIRIRGWTASFRYPIFVSGYQPSLPVPPLSTIYGLISSVCGKIVTPNDTKVGYIFFSKGKTVDIETIYELSNSDLQCNTNIVKREILYEPELFLYVSNLDMASCFTNPVHSIVLGRSSDLASIENVNVLSLSEKTGVPCGGSIFPFPTEGISGIIQALPSFFSVDIPRKAMNTKPFCMVETDFSNKDKFKKPQTSKTKLFYDEEHDWGFYLH